MCRTPRHILFSRSWLRSYCIAPYMSHYYIIYVICLAFVWRLFVVSSHDIIWASNLYLISIIYAWACYGAYIWRECGAIIWLWFVVCVIIWAWFVYLGWFGGDGFGVYGLDLLDALSSLCHS